MRPRRMSTQRGLWGEEGSECQAPPTFGGRDHRAPPPAEAALQQKKDSSHQVQVKSSANDRGSLVGGGTLGTLPQAPPTHPPLLLLCLRLQQDGHVSRPPAHSLTLETPAADSWSTFAENLRPHFQPSRSIRRCLCPRCFHSSWKQALC